MKRAIILAVILLASCGGIPKTAVRLSDRVVVDYNNNPRQDKEILAAWDILTHHAERKCGLKPAALTAYYNVQATRFKCGNVDAQGCYPMAPFGIMYYVHREQLWYSAAIHEGLHHVWTLCYGRSGADNDQNHEDAFLEEVEILNEQLRIRFEGTTP